MLLALSRAGRRILHLRDLLRCGESDLVARKLLCFVSVVEFHFALAKNLRAWPSAFDDPAHEAGLGVNHDFIDVRILVESISWFCLHVMILTQGDALSTRV